MGTERRSVRRRAGAMVLALLLLSGCASAPADPVRDMAEVTILLAQNVSDELGLKNAEGQPLRPRSAPEMKGRGSPDVPGEEPDYRGVVGYAALQTGWEVSRFNTFAVTPWMLPVYGPDRTEQPGDMIRHKTPVLVADQSIREGNAYQYTGYLRVIRLDTMKETWIDVTQFVTVPYWTLNLTEAVQYGYAIAVYRSRSSWEPMDRKNHRGTVPDGTRVLLCCSDPPRFSSPDGEHNPVLGIVFRSKNKGGSHFRTFLFFNPDDLDLIY